MVRKLKKEDDIVEGAPYELTGAFSGEPELPYGEVTLDFGIGNQMFKYTFCIAELTNPDCIILGQDFWKEQNTVLKNNFGQYAFWLNGQRIKVIPESSKTGSLPKRHYFKTTS